MSGREKGHYYHKELTSQSAIQPAAIPPNPPTQLVIVVEIENNTSIITVTFFIRKNVKLSNKMILIYL